MKGENESIVKKNARKGPGWELEDASKWELAAESIVVRMRWFGVAMGYILVQSRVALGVELRDPSAVRAFLALGAGYAALDLAFHRMGEVFLKRAPLFVATMESIFIALLCYHDTGLNSPFRWYYLLSLVCCAIRYRPATAWLTFCVHCASLLCLTTILEPSRADRLSVPVFVGVLAWVTWAGSALSTLLKDTGRRLERVNEELRENRAELERRVLERSEALRAAQARVIHQEKMAAFGLLAAGIAHEVGNPLAALSSLVQLLRRRQPDTYSLEKLDLAARQLDRIGRTLRELVDFSRPGPLVEGPVRIREVVDEALGIAKYYHSTKGRIITTELAEDVPNVRAVRDHLVQVVLNLVLNAIDATVKGGRIDIKAETIEQNGTFLVLTLQDDGRGISIADQCRLFQPYFTTKTRGTGLGLYISREIVEEFGGRLTFESDLGRGATFSVRLPALKVEPTRSISVAAEARSA